MTDGNLSQAGALDGSLEILDEANKVGGRVTDTGIVLNTSSRNTVQVLTSNGDTDDEIGKLSSVLLDGLRQSVKLLVNVVGTRGPDTKQYLGLGLDSSLEGRDWVLLGVGLDVGVQPDGIEVARRTLQVLCSLKLGQEILLELSGSVGLGSSRVEAEVVFGGSGGSESQSKSRRETHGDYGM